MVGAIKARIKSLEDGSDVRIVCVCVCVCLDATALCIFRQNCSHAVFVCILRDAVLAICIAWTWKQRNVEDAFIHR